MIPNVEDVDDVIVGKRYRVPVVILKNRPKALSLLPVIGPQHEDKEFINFPARHWHPDRRFITQEWFDDLEADGASHWAIALTLYPSTHSSAFVHHATNEPMVVDGGRRVMTCKRLVESFCERDGKPPRWLPKLEAAYKDDRLRNMICPHRGISCVGVIPEADGGIVCVGHGLKWNPKTGEMISRVGSDLRQKSLLK